MSNYLKIKSPGFKQAKTLASTYGIANHGFKHLDTAYWNLSTPALYEEAIFRNEGNIVNQGPLLVNTGKHTARAANDKFVVQEDTSSDDIWWGDYNRPISSE
jgi:phosphoenolpyruvate carboxykinase (ATP)